MTQVSTKYCRYCGRLLKSKESIERGFGLTCYKKYLQSLNSGGLLGILKERNKQDSLAQ